MADVISVYEWLQSYQKDVFDCSEMSAYIECDLENKGCNTIIVIEDSPFGSGRHAWILFETSEEQYIPIETTIIKIVWWDNPNFELFHI